jgi:MFS family permease
VVVTFVRAGGIALAAVSAGFGKATVGLVAHFAGMGASDPLLGAWVNEHAIREQRATILSIQAMAFMFGGSAGLLTVGLIARAWGAPVAWGVAAVVLLGCAILAWGADEENVRSAGVSASAPGAGSPVLRSAPESAGEAGSL